MMPEAVIFSADLFNALYMATCMGSASSALTVAVIVLVDIAQSDRVLRRLHRRTDTILTRLHDARGTMESDRDLASAANCLCRCTSKFKKLDRRGVRIRSCLPHCVSSEGRKLLDHLETQYQSMDEASHYTFSIRHDAPATKDALFEVCGKTDRTRQTAIVPVGTTVCPAIPDIRRLQSEQINGTTSAPVDANILRETLEFMFTSKRFVLNAYVNAVVPLLHGYFLVVKVQLPNAK